ncbi:rhomboid family intramembrane serine protease [Winogradskyella maritima]|uniref:Rhomboid family intramembrane serine protease n=1 Tax=Winogradskyella maritima TaxID=1517766 RepID=A0ABV8AKG1_9FLAO|nr:rhomboid family intramembrane serine protease [Winogradskyella maritima]
MRLGITDAVKHLIIINVVMFIGTLTVGGGTLFYDWFAEFFPLNDSFGFWQLVTSIFIHFDIGHLFSNMLMLFFTGIMIEQVLGTKRFLFLFLSAGLGGNLIALSVDYIQFSLALNELTSNGFDKAQVLEVLNSKLGRYDLRWQNILSETQFKHLVVNFNSRSAGASGAVMGILAVLGLMFPERKIMLLFPPIPIKIKYLVVGLIGSDFFMAIFTGSSLIGSTGTGYVAHLGGAIVGALIYLFWKKNSMDKYRWN